MSITQPVGFKSSADGKQREKTDRNRVNSSPVCGFYSFFLHSVFFSLQILSFSSFPQLYFSLHRVTSFPFFSSYLAYRCRVSRGLSPMATRPEVVSWSREREKSVYVCACVCVCLYVQEEGMAFLSVQ